jgi:tetratricopeptide (TPR) repeat protein
MTELSAIRIQENFVLYRSYLWAVGSCVVLPLLLERFDKRMASIVVGAIVLAMFPISMERLASFSHPLVLWDDAEKLVKGRPELPGAYRIYYNRGTELLKVDEYDAAIRDLKLSAELQPDWPYSYNNLGAAYANKMDWDGAVTAFSNAIEIAQRKNMGVNVKPYWGRALAYENLGKFDLALKDYEVTCRFAKKGCEKLTK